MVLATEPKLKNLHVEEKKNIELGEIRFLKVSGHIDWQPAGDSRRIESPFELFLERGEQGESWRLAKPVELSTEKETQDWITYPIPVRDD